MGKKNVRFLRKNFSPIIWIMFLFFYIEARFMFHIFDISGFPFYYKMAYHIIFFVPLGIFLWRREFSILNIVVIMTTLAFIPEGYQYYRAATVPLSSHVLDFSLNLVGGAIGICIGMMWTLKELITK